ncbi:uncharacterized protein LOC119991230 [Tripterygium wilfordii]|uniref:uncharacterized protein LOC119991230 n=1 Tax=Tripterygium wilfordii TaxID=458696 RepID=UPI0018F82712|nr:uncharacterized protein LOC119991230 [Tripterygium wilfordii]
MYVTRPLSMFKRFPQALSETPPEGPNSGILVILDEEAQPTGSSCFGLCKSGLLPNLPFPQNKNLKIQYTVGQSTEVNPVILIPALDQPLSSNRYYAIQPKGSHIGEAFTNSREEDKSTCCFCNCIKDLKPQPFDHHNMYQQFEIRRRDWGCYTAKSVAPDGFPPSFLRRKGWTVYASTPKDFDLAEARGLDTTLRARLPDFNNFPLTHKTSPSVVVGKWYCPFLFIKEGTLKDQISRSRYYEMTLEQRWEQIFACESSPKQGNQVFVDVNVQKEVVQFGDGREVVQDNSIDGEMWFRSQAGDAIASVGLSLAIVDRMKWEEERFGWSSNGNEREVRVKRVEEFKGMGEWTKFGCYVLVERFVLKRMDRSLVLTYEFRYTQQIRAKWE